MSRTLCILDRGKKKVMFRCIFIWYSGGSISFHLRTWWQWILTVRYHRCHDERCRFAHWRQTTMSCINNNAIDALAEVNLGRGVRAPSAQSVLCTFSIAHIANRAHLSKGGRGLLTASTRFTTDLAKFLVCCLVLCRLNCGGSEKKKKRTLIRSWRQGRHLRLSDSVEHLLCCGRWQS